MLAVGTSDIFLYGTTLTGFHCPQPVGCALLCVAVLSRASPATPFPHGPAYRTSIARSLTSGKVQQQPQSPPAAFFDACCVRCWCLLANCAATQAHITVMCFGRCTALRRWLCQEPTGAFAWPSQHLFAGSGTEHALRGPKRTGKENAQRKRNREAVVRLRGGSVN